MIPRTSVREFHKSACIRPHIRRCINVSICLCMYPVYLLCSPYPGMSVRMVFSLSIYPCPGMYGHVAFSFLDRQELLRSQPVLSRPVLASSLPSSRVFSVRTDTEKRGGGAILWSEGGGFFFLSATQLPSYSSPVSTPA